MSTSLASLKERALSLQKARRFFEERGVIEVDTCLLSPFPPIDLHIDPMEVPGQGYLHTSPEYAMKKLIAEGSGDIYQLSHVFRRDEVGRWHRPEFTMLEYYRVGMLFDRFIDECVELFHLFIGDVPTTKYRYEELFQKFLGIDPFRDLLPSLPGASSSLMEDRDTHLQLLFAEKIEPHLQDLTIVTDWPPTQAALAKVEGGRATRFEIYYRGVELANGFDELNSGVEQKNRFETINNQRIEIGKKAFPIDEKLIEAVENLPACCGVAIGFDRLIALANGEGELNPKSL